jgi:hypothetical protein
LRENAAENALEAIAAVAKLSRSMTNTCGRPLAAGVNGFHRLPTQ